MKYLKMLGLAAVAAAALMAFVGAGTASATTLEVNGVTRNEAITITASLKSGTSAILRDTAGFSTNTCTSSHVHGITEGITHSNGVYTAGVYTGYELKGNLTEGSNGLSFSSCTNEPVVVHNGGALEIIWSSGTNGTVTSSGAVVTTNSAFGTLTCETGEKTHIGTLTGVASGHATMDINGQFPCSGISSRWTATYTVTTPTGLGVSP